VNSRVESWDPKIEHWVPPGEAAYLARNGSLSP
jgi:hypothetical protein